MKKIKPFVSGIALAILLLMTSIAEAGMPAVTLSDFGANRLIGISTALFVLIIVVATLLMVCWNKLVEGSTWPKLSHPKAIGVAFLAGLFSFLVLVMIAGSRELLTPKAWQPNGILYKIAPQEPQISPTVSAAIDAEKLIPIDDTPEARLAVRREKLAQIRIALWHYADTHNGTFPASLARLNSHLNSQITNPNPQFHTLPVSGGLQYVYQPEGEFLVAEPDLNEGPRLAINRQGVIVSLEVSVEPIANEN